MCRLTTTSAASIAAAATTITSSTLITTAATAATSSASAGIGGFVHTDHATIEPVIELTNVFVKLTKLECSLLDIVHLRHCFVGILIGSESDKAKATASPSVAVLDDNLLCDQRMFSAKVM